MSLFVSYTRKDDTVVRGLVADLQRLGRPVWMDHNIHGGEIWWREIIREIQRARVFVFALSNESWRSQPCRRELEYAEKLGVPILPVRVGPLESMFIPLGEKQIIDYSGRTADSVVGLVAALTELTAHPYVPPNPLPEPPEVPFSYLYRIASRLGPNPISMDDQEELISKLRRKFKEEDDELARADIVKLMRELRERRELTVQSAREIDEVLTGVTAETPEDGATRLPPADHWRRAPGLAEVAVTQPITKKTEEEKPESAEPPPAPEPSPAPAPEPPETKAEPQPQPQPQATPEPETPTESGTSPAWLADLLQQGQAGHTQSATATQPAPAPPTGSGWVTKLQTVHPAGTAPQPPATGVPATPEPEAETPDAAPKSSWLAFAGAVLGALGVPLLLLALAHNDEVTVKGPVTVVLQIAAGLGLVLSVVSAVRREPWSRAAVLVALAGVLGAVVFAVTG